MFNPAFQAEADTEYIAGCTDTCGIKDHLVSAARADRY